MRTILWVNSPHRWSWMEHLWCRLSTQYLVSTLGQGYMEGIVFQRATNRFPALSKSLNSRAERWMWRSAKPAFGSKSQKIFPQPSIQYLWHGTAQAQGWDFLPCPGRTELQRWRLWDLPYSQRSKCREEKSMQNTFYFCYDQQCFLENQNHSESFMLLHNQSALQSHLLWVNFKPYI